MDLKVSLLAASLWITFEGRSWGNQYSSVSVQGERYPQGGYFHLRTWYGYFLSYICHRSCLAQIWLPLPHRLQLWGKTGFLKNVIQTLTVFLLSNVETWQMQMKGYICYQVIFSYRTILHSSLVYLDSCCGFWGEDVVSECWKADMQVSSCLQKEMSF